MTTLTGARDVIKGPHKSSGWSAANQCGVVGGLATRWPPRTPRYSNSSPVTTSWRRRTTGIPKEPSSCTWSWRDHPARLRWPAYGAAASWWCRRTHKRRRWWQRSRACRPRPWSSRPWPRGKRRRSSTRCRYQGTRWRRCCRWRCRPTSPRIRRWSLPLCLQRYLHHHWQHLLVTISSFALKAVTRNSFCASVFSRPFCHFPSFPTRKMVGADDLLYMKFRAKLAWPVPLTNADFQLIFARSASAVTPSEISSINTNTKSTTGFPMNLTWTSYVDRKLPIRWFKNAKWTFFVKNVSPIGSPVRGLQCVFSPVHSSCPFLSSLSPPSLSFSSLSLASKWLPNSAKGSEEALLAPPVKKTTFSAATHVPWALNTPNTRLRPSPVPNAFLMYSEPVNVSDGWKSRTVDVKRNLKIEANVVVSECTINVVV